MSKAGDWRCPCGTNNFAKRLNCIECHRAKAKCVTTDHPGDWWCPHCHVTNFSYRTECKTCQRPKPVTPDWDPTPTPASKWKEGDWRCPCGTVNFASRSACFRCGLTKAPQATTGDANATPTQGNAPATGSDLRPTAVPPQGKPGDWSCTCGTLNFAHRSACFRCNTPKGTAPIQQQQQLHPASSTPPPATLPPSANPANGAPPTFDRKPGDWNCPQCSFVNFGSRRVCMKCGAENPVTTSPPPASLQSSVGGKASVDPNSTSVAGLPSYFAPPAYWRLSATASVTPPPTKGGVTSLYEVYDDSAMESMVRQLFAADAPSLKVAQVRRLENPILWQAYRAECGRLVAKYGDRGCQPLPSHVAPTTLLNHLVDDLKINEVLLMHGTRPEIGLTIMNNGFDPSHSGEASGSLYGQGTYFSDSLKKVLQYSKGCILVSRVALGEPALPPFQNPHTFRRPPVKPAGTAGTSGAPDEFDCVIGGSSYKEFIVYRHTKAYPEFVVFHGA